MTALSLTTLPRLAALLLGATVLGAMPGTAPAAPTLALPAEAIRTTEAVAAPGSYALPTGPWADGRISTRQTEGTVTSTAWRIGRPGITTLGLLAPLRDQLVGEGFRILFECDTEACGGFDFRYDLAVLPEPEMHVDLGDFRFLSAERTGPKGTDYIGLLVSRSSSSGFVQMTRVGGAGDAPVALASVDPDASLLLAARAGPGATPPPLPKDALFSPDATTFAARLESQGVVALDDLAFDSGAGTLEEGTFASLDALAAYLESHPDRRIVLVGHTDATGALAANVALSRRRAEAVAERLTGDYGVDPARLSAEGVGYLGPRASNLTDAGRRMNRRVEAMLASTR
ncbi:MAG: OmpA family protein [Alphaproteobacteria bacterium HGW-Alphaproteobacteria-6]|nr:MAG: OmpA family protein [Alphaproteobacteria bacterium HGW-Alphaproteobacteria-6]